MNIQISGLPFLLFLIFLVLKLTGYIAWSWLWVTSPIWLPLAVGLLIALCGGVFFGFNIRGKK